MVANWVREGVAGHCGCFQELGDVLLGTGGVKAGPWGCPPPSIKAPSRAASVISLGVTLDSEVLVVRDQFGIGP